MKKILVLTTLALSFAGSAFAAALSNGVLTVASGGSAIYGGQSAAAALAATGPQIKLSTKVVGKVNWEAANAATGLSVSYEIFAKHDGGSKVFGTANSSTNIYYKIVPAKPFSDATVTTALGTVTNNDGTDFTSATSWTAF